MKREREREKKLANEGEVTELKQKDKKTTKWLYVSQKKKNRLAVSMCGTYHIRFLFGNFFERLYPSHSQNYSRLCGTF